MSEKKGHTIKLFNPFPVEKCLEVEMNGEWYRVISKEFRSWMGRRRIIISYDENRKPIYEEYNGPRYQEGTNRVIKE